MLLDFANSALKTKIMSSSLCADGYGVENLINSKDHTRITFDSKFFMAEYFVKCPVKVLLEFPFLIDISYIVMNPRGTTHHSKVVEVFTSYYRPLKSKENLPCSYGGNPTEFYTNWNHYNLAGKYNEKNYNNPNNGASQVVLFNSRHQTQYHQHREVIGNEIPLKPISSVSCCSHLLLNIPWATIPVIRSLQVWATVSQRNPLFLKDHIALLMNQMRSFQNNKTSLTSVKGLLQPSQLLKEDKLAPTSSKNSKTVDEQIPDEFLDSITMSVMTIPLLLPSGNNIDQTTYDKFVTNEQVYGRLPSDPFTGIVFHESTKPIPNTSLKLRIDEYLLKNKIEEEQPKVYLLGSDVKTNRKEPQKRKLLSTNTSSLSSGVLEPTASHKHRKVDSSHQSELENSLNCALSEILIPSCLISKSKSASVPLCTKCNNADKLRLYALPCTHLLCNLCLNNRKQCNKCSKPFKHIEVKKYR